MNRTTRDVARAVELLIAGEVVAIPTETVYGLAAVADNRDAVRRVFSVKGRPPTHPLIVHVASIAEAERYGVIDQRTRALIDVVWPGPLTIVVQRRELANDDITGGHDTVAIRMPSHPVALELLERLGCAVVAPSANKFGMVSPTCAEHVERDLGDEVSIILDGGPCAVGVESTIVDCTTSPMQILRPGAISSTDIERIVNEATSVAAGPSRAPGMLASHYAPRCAVETFESLSEAKLRAAAIHELGGSPVIVDRSTDAIECARWLYADLRRCDDDGASHALFVLPSVSGIGLAIRDRLAKASAPRH